MWDSLDKTATAALLKGSPFIRNDGGQSIKWSMVHPVKPRLWTLVQQ